MPLSQSLFISFLEAFWTTLINEWSFIPALRMDKYLRLVRLYISASFTYISNHKWNPTLSNDYLELVERLPLIPDNGKVPDGLKYHVLDVWIDGLESVETSDVDIRQFLRPIEILGREGRTKKIRERAREVLGDDRLKAWQEEINSQEDSGEEDEWNGFDEQ